MSKNNSVTIMKFGGTSVQDSDSIQNVINIVRKTHGKKVVVVSAIANATNLLEQMAKLASMKNIEEAKELLETIIDRHYKIINNLVSDLSLREEAHIKILEYWKEISDLIEGLAIIRELSLRTLDAFRVFGELMSSTVIYFSMLSAKLKVIRIDSRDVIKTDNEFSRAYPNFDLTQKNIDELVIPHLNKGKIVLAQGFIGSTEDGISTTMGRESSDFSAAIYGSILNADEIQIWTDVDGVLTADPNIIKSPMKLSEISFQEMEELSNFGAKVLHKNSVQPAFKKNIPIRILNSKNISSKGTLVTSELHFHNVIKSITYKKNIIVLRLKPKESLNQYIFWEMMLNILSKHKPQIDILVSSNNALLIVIAENAYTKIHYDELINEFGEIADGKIIKDKVLITLVGSDLNEIENFEQKIFNSFTKIKPESIVYGYNQHSFSLLINSDEFEEVINKLHSGFFGKNQKLDKLFQKVNSKL